MRSTIALPHRHDRVEANLSPADIDSEPCPQGHHSLHTARSLPGLRQDHGVSFYPHGRYPRSWSTTTISHVVMGHIASYCEHLRCLFISAIWPVRSLRQLVGLMIILLGVQNQVLRTEPLCQRKLVRGRGASLLARWNFQQILQAPHHLVIPLVQILRSYRAGLALVQTHSCGKFQCPALEF
jgi:hypothetical protein